MVLDLIRQSAPFRKQTSLNGFYQDNGGDADLLRLNLSLDSQLYPQISGHKSRFAIRFMPLDTENGQVPEPSGFRTGLLLRSKNVRNYYGELPNLRENGGVG